MEAIRTTINCRQPYSPNLTIALFGLISFALMAGCAMPITKPERPGRLHRQPSFSIPTYLRQSAAINIEELLAKSEKSKLLSVVVRLKVDRAPGGRAKPDAILAAQKSLQQGLSGTGFRVKRLFRHIPYATLEMDKLALRRLAKLDVVAGVSEEAEFYPFLSQSSNIVDASWSSKQGFSGRGAAVAIIDGGTVHHSFFGDRLVEEFCFSSPGWGVESLCREGASEDSGPGAACAFPVYCDHGTHVAGIAAGDNDSMSGIAREADIIALNAFVKKTPLLKPPYNTYLTSDLVAALEQVLDLTDTRTVAAVNMSLGGPPWAEGTCDTHSENERAIKVVVDLLREAGVATVAASGNNGEANKIASPACISSVISVGATDKQSIVADFSDSSGQLDFLAPGVDIVSSVPGGFEAFDGTSMAAPHVTGAWAVLKAEKPTASVDDIETALKQSGRMITDPRQGRRRPMIQVEEAMQLILPPEVRIYPANGIYQTPHEVHIHVRDRVGLARDLKTWVTTNGQAPEENAAGAATLPCEDFTCDFYILTIDEPGTVVVLARAFFSLLDGTRVGTRTAEGLYVLREPDPGPDVVQASDGTFPDRIRITWTPVPDADRYDVFGSLRDHTPGSFAWQLNSTSTLLTDTTFDYFPGTGTGEVLYYFVRGRVNGFPTLFGGPDTGYAQVGSIPVQATDGTDPEGIRLSWDPTPWKTPGLHVVYEIYRSTDTDLSHAVLIATREGTFINNYPAGVIIRAAAREYLDRDIAPNQTYFYWVKGIDGADVSSLGDGESGYLAGP